MAASPKIGDIHAMTILSIIDNRKVIRYTGSNSAEMDANIPDFTISSEGAGVLDFTSNGSPFTANTNDYVMYWQGYVMQVFNTTAYNTFFTEYATASDLSTLSTQVSTNTTDIATLNATVATLGGAALRSAGVATAPTLLLGIPANVDVPLTPPMPNTSFTPYRYVFGGVNLTSITINSTTILNASTVRVNLQTSLVSLAGVHVLVTAKS